MNTITKKRVSINRAAINTGDRFGRLTITQEIEDGVHPSGQRYRKVECVCECGHIFGYSLHSLRKGNTQSCGCLKQSVDHARFLTHGHSKTESKAYKSWRAMNARCCRPSHKNYERYGGRGIKICDRWADKNGFTNFLFDMGEPPEKFSLDRIDNDGNYEPANCRWASQLTQARNSSKVKKLTFRGVSRCLSEWAEITGISSSTIWQRIYSRGWSIEETLTTPPILKGTRKKDKAVLPNKM